MNASFTEVKDLVCCIEISENYFICKAETVNVYLLPGFLKIICLDLKHHLKVHHNKLVAFQAHC